MRFLATPTDFHSCLIRAIANSKNSIYLSTLYLGDSIHSRTEGALRRELNAALERGVRVNILADFARSSRPGLDERWAKQMESRYQSRFEFNYFACNNPAIPVTPSPFREIFGLFHFKLNIFDDDQILITGANLSENYFTNRQDRYFWLEKERSLADYCKILLDRLHSLSHRSTERRAPAVCPFKNPLKFRRLVEMTLADICSKPRMFISQSHEKVWFWPVLQLNGLGINDEVKMIAPLLSPEKPAVKHITSPYFNFPPLYRDLLAGSEHDIHILTASPESNGFYGASGLKKHIPDVYATIESKFLRHVAANPNVKLYNYRRAGWSYHGKGVWITPLDEGDTTSITLHLPYSSQIGCSGSTDGLPILTTIGSSNYGYRSLYRDMEFQLIIYTQSKDIQRLMLQDRENLWQHAAQCSDRKNHGRSNWWIPLVLPFVKTMF